jgi:hypothetical protein
MATDTVFILGRVVSQPEPNKLSWRLLGIFDDAENAEQHCQTREDFVRPLPRNVPLPAVTPRPTGIYFPLREKEKK